ncbi:MAG: RecQ family ATP-dependent DNA helicase [Alistipes sp.]|nr:RecQ family ATP-dependent DNA helicase [Alistipes sp.]
MEARYREIMRRYWGYGEFRPGQADVMMSVGSGWDTLVLMPTGAGKSLLYQVPAMDKEGVCLVVSPLVALMKDQVDRLRSLGIAAAAIHSSLTSRQIDIILDNASWGDLKFLYVAPERLLSPVFRERVTRMPVSLLAVDEAHCISQWGYDFRPSYLRIGELRERLEDVPVLALTASATPTVARDIMHHLGMKEGRIKRTSFERRNISYAVRHSDDKAGQLLRILGNVPGTAIVYVRLREEAERTASMLADNGIPAAPYHAGIDAKRRSESQERWLKNEVRVMVCTNAFGMGIDKPDVRLVVHYDMTDSPESYYQESGRAGRDGKRSYAVLLAASDDWRRAVRSFGAEFPPLEKIRECYQALFDYLQIGIGDGKYYSAPFDLFDFASRNRMHHSTALSALKILQQNGYLTLTPESDNPPRIHFLVGRDDLYKIRIDREELDHILTTILRLYAGVFGDRLVPIDENEIAQWSGYKTDKVRELLKKLWTSRIIRYVPGSRSPVLLLTEERLPTRDVYISPESYRIRKEMAAARLKAMHEYANGEGQCRQVFLRKYFGEEDPADCGSCDVCIAKKKLRSKQADTDDLEQRVLRAIETEPLAVKELAGELAVPAAGLSAAVESLTARGIIYCREDGKLAVKR